MPYSTESPEWRLLQQVAEPLASRKTAFQPSPREWQSTHIDSDHYLERGLRELFLIRSHKFYLEDADFKSFRNKLDQLCRILDDAVNPVISRTTGKNRTYPLLSGLVIFLKDSNADSEINYDLACTISEPLFAFPDEVKKRCSNLVKDTNSLMSDYSTKPCETETKATGGLKRQQWRSSKIRARASDVFQMIFERFTCPERHELLIEFAIACSGNDKPSDMELSISRCLTDYGRNGWQSVVCNSKSEQFYKQEVYDLCADMNMFSGHDQDLHLLPCNGELLSAWSSRSIARPGLEDTAKESLSERIASGMFKPLTASYFIAQQLNTQRLVRRYTLKRKRILAVELGYWLLDFFDASLNSNDIYFFESFNELAKKDRFYCSFSTQFPTSPEFRVFQIGHPVLLTLAKILLELDDGEMIPVKICPHYGEENSQAWFQLMSALQLKGPGLDESYTKAVRGCLNVHTHLQDVDTESDKADMMIRDHLYHHIVQHLEISLEVRLTPLDVMRTPQIPTVAHDPKLMRNPTASSQPKENADSGLFKHTQLAAERTVSPTLGAHIRESFNVKRGTEVQSHRVDSTEGYSRRPTKQTESFADRGPNRRGNAPKNRRDFEVAIICALPLEFDTIQLLFDRKWEERQYQFGKLEGDSNFYVNGRLGNLDVVVLLLSKIGKASATNAATNLRLSYPGLKLALLSGVCGGIPKSYVPNREETEVLLGDVFVSSTMIESVSSKPTLFGDFIVDVMGLGKTLTILAAILHSTKTAEDFRNVSPTLNDGDNTTRTKATLIVVPSTQLMESWMTEIETHFLPCSLSCVRFHGQDRPGDPEALRSTDIVLTTYATVASDHGKNGLLCQMGWFRVVLDEGMDNVSLAVRS
ncbi:Ff.00g085670.m01.CDS01 [Fusarium sp. VM40]|nr:Ff.00g085670.m01.CDS01 [Fusarium sp. VM40]